MNTNTRWLQSSVKFCLVLLLGVSLKINIVNAAHRFIEFQLPTDTIAQLIWDRLYAERICVIEPFPFPPPNGASVVLDRVEFPTKPTIVNQNSQTRVRIRVDVFLRSEECLTRDCGQNEYQGLSGQQTGPLALELSYIPEIVTVPNSQNRQICMNFGSIRNTADNTIFPASSLPTTINQIFELPCADLPLAALDDLLPENSQITDLDISSSLAGDRLGLRFEVDGPTADSDASWQTFRAGTLGPSDSQLEWSMFIDRRIFVERERMRLDHRLLCRETPSNSQCDRDFDDDGILCRDGDPDDSRCSGRKDFIRTSGPTVSYASGGTFGGGHLDIMVSGRATETPCPNDINVDPVDIDTDFRINTGDPGWLKYHLLIDPDPDDDDVVECAFLLATPANPLGHLSVLIVTSVIADIFDPEPGQLTLPDACNDINSQECIDRGRFCNQIDDDEYDCGERIDIDDPIDFGGPTFAQLHLEKIFGKSAGLVMGGLFERVFKPVTPMPLMLPNPATIRRPLLLDNGIIRYGVQGDCSNLHLGYSGSFRAQGDGEMCLPYQVLDDPPREHENFTLQFSPDEHNQTENSIYGLMWPGFDAINQNLIGEQIVDIKFPDTHLMYVQPFLDNPYPLKVLVRSTVGLQHFTIDAPNSIEGEFFLEELSKAYNQCNAKSWHRIMPQALLDLLWLVDPPPFRVELFDRLNNTLSTLPGLNARLSNLTVNSQQSVEMMAVRNFLTGKQQLEFPSSELLFSGILDVRLRSGRSFKLPFNKTLKSSLLLIDLNADQIAELGLQKDLEFSVKLPQKLLPRGAKTEEISFRIGADKLRFNTKIITELEQPKCSGINYKKGEYPRLEKTKKSAEELIKK